MTSIATGPVPLAANTAAHEPDRAAPPDTPVVVFPTGLYAPDGRDSVSIHNRDWMVGLHDRKVPVFALDMANQGSFSTVLNKARTVALVAGAYGWPRTGTFVASLLVRSHRLLSPTVALLKRLKGRRVPQPAVPGPIAAADRPAGPPAFLDRDTRVIDTMLLKGGNPQQRGHTEVACVLTGYDLLFAPRWAGVWKDAIAIQLKRYFPDLRDIRWYVHVVSETTRVAPALVTGSDMCDEVWAPSPFNMEALRRTGLKTPHLYKLPEAYDETIFHPGVRPAVIPGRRGFCFLTLSQYLPDELAVTDARQPVRDLALLWNQARKATPILIRAFLEEFTADEDVCLVIKSTQDPATLMTAVRRILTRIGCDERRLDQIVPYGEWTAPMQLPSIYAAADALALVSRGEGWGRPLFEAMALGKPVIGTNFGGNLEFMTHENSYLVDCTLVPVASVIGRKFASLGEWAEPSLTHLRQTLRAVFTDREEAGRRGRRAAIDVRSGYSREAIAQLTLERISARPRRSNEKSH